MAIFNLFILINFLPVHKIQFWVINSIEQVQF